MTCDGEAALKALRTARAGIEARFLGGGAALTTVLDIVNRLLTALDGVARAMEAGEGDDADRLARTSDRLIALPAAERGRRQRLARMMSETAEIRATMEQMSSTLSQVRVCALMTKITSTGMPEFAGFAEDMIGSAVLAEGQVGVFAERLARLRANLISAREEGDRTATATETVAPELGGVLLGCADFMSARRNSLGQLAAEVGALAQEVRAKVSVVLSALQIGDITRQRIEHVEAGLVLIEALLERDSPTDGAAFADAATRLLAAQMEDLSAEFRDGSGRIVVTLGEIGKSAQAILSARGAVASSPGDAGFLGELDRKIGEARLVVCAIDQARTKSAEIGAAAVETAEDLLGNVSRIGDIKAVKDDMRRLAINAYIKCTRVGERGRAVAAVAMELQELAMRLGGLTDHALTAVSQLKDSATAGGDGEVEPLGAALETVAEGVRAARARMDANLAEMDLLSAGVAKNVDATIDALDFESDLGEALSRAGSSLAKAADGFARGGAEPCDRLRAFSDELLGLYTMASERAVHRKALPWALVAAPSIEPSEDELLEDALF